MTDNPPSDPWGVDVTWAEMEAEMIAQLPNRLRERCCHPDEPWVSRGTDPGHHDHGHTDCYLMNLAADEIERLRGCR